ncbi:flagellin N-terminal helical domain-containing protein [Algicola sagamiensis]|uniref:flagellin N-terminal helical domain-containing protein n=1 Tax=Algicola sagamiensis TaxID=163869 RepID=UPI00035C7149|nr:flagellin [Algicola sagamiensis]
MVMRIDGGINSFLTQTQTEKTNNLFKQLASGQRINSAADDAAGLQILDRLNAELDAFQQGIQNGSDGLSLAQTAEGALSGIGDSVSRIRELSLQASNGALTDADRTSIQSEIDQLTTQVNDTVQNTSFGGVDLLNQNGSLNIQLSGDSTVGVSTFDVGTDLDGLGLNNIDVTTQAGAQAAIGTADGLQARVNEIRGELGAQQNAIESSIRGLANQQVNTAAAAQRIGDTDFASASSQRAQNDFLNQASLSVQSQANLSQRNVLSLLG